MAQITGIGFSNFRVFKEASFFDLAPITIFTGANNSGKSSVFKGLLLMKDNAEDLGELKFTGEEHKLGTFELARNSRSEDKGLRKQVRLDLAATSPLFQQHIVELSYLQDHTGESGKLDSIYISDANGVIKSNSTKDALAWCYTHGNVCSIYLNIRSLLKRYRDLIAPSFDRYMTDNGYSIHDGNVLVSLTFERDSDGTPESYPGADLIFKGHESALDSLKQYNGSIISLEKLRNLLPEQSLDVCEQLKEVLEVKVLERLSHQKIYWEEWTNLPRPLGFLDNFFSVFEMSEFSEPGIDNIQKGSLAELIKDEFPEVSSQLEEKNPNLRTKFGRRHLFAVRPYLSEVFEPGFVNLCRNFISPSLRSFLDSLKEELCNSLYLEAVRANTHRMYTNSSQGTSFNDLLLKIASNPFFAGEKEKPTEYKNTDKKTATFVNDWLSRFGFGEKLTIRRIKGVVTEVSIDREGRQVDLVDLGYGATQFLPLLLYPCLHAQRKRTPSGSKMNDIDNASYDRKLLLIEEPEANLHPKLQSLLADFFVDVAKNFDVTLLIETHSEYLIRRLQVLTAAGNVRPSDSVIYYLNDKDAMAKGEPQVKKININPDGTLTNEFGPGFIDEATNWKLELMRLKNAHLKNVN